MCALYLRSIGMDGSVILKNSFTILAFTAWVQGTALHTPVISNLWSGLGK